MMSVGTRYTGGPPDEAAVHVRHQLRLAGRSRREEHDRLVVWPGLDARELQPAAPGGQVSVAQAPKVVDVQHRHTAALQRARHRRDDSADLCPREGPLGFPGRQHGTVGNH